MNCFELHRYLRKEKRNEKNVSAFQDQETAQVWFPRQNGNPRRPQGSRPSSSERPQETRSLIEMISVRVDSAPSVETVGNTGFRLKPDCRLKLKSEFDAVKKNGRRVTTRYFTALVSGWEFGISRKCGVICSRKFDKRAVRRNRARRLVRESFRLLQNEISPCGIVVIPRREILRAKMQDVKAVLAKALAKAGVMTPV